MGFIDAEQSNPKTRTLDKTIAKSAVDGVRMLLSVDEDLVSLYRNTLFSDEFDHFCESVKKTLAGGGRIVLSGCGSTGRLCMNVEKSWRRATKRCGLDETLGDRVLTIMTGGDYAVIRSVENFEDYDSFSRRQAAELGVGAGDLYVTVYGGRTRLVGILLGRGLNIDEAKAELNGVTLESLVVAERVARAVRVCADKGILNLKDFPLLMHVDEIISDKKEVNIPWESFTFEF